jgi:hypothetical protein
MILLRVLGYIWALPCVLLASPLIAYCRPTGVRISGGVLELTVKRMVPSWAYGQAIGWVVLYGDRVGFVVAGNASQVHEHKHVGDYLWLGVFFWALYFGEYGVRRLRGESPGDAYHNLWLERRARTAVAAALEAA